MSTELLEAPTCLAPDRPVHAGSVGAAGVSLDDLIAAAWEGLALGAQVRCPVCHERMGPGSASGRVGSGGRCSTCASDLF